MDGYVEIGNSCEECDYTCATCDGLLDTNCLLCDGETDHRVENNNSCIC